MKKKLLILLVLMSSVCVMHAQVKKQYNGKRPKVSRISKSLEKTNVSEMPVKTASNFVIEEIGDRNDFRKTNVSSAATVKYIRPEGTFFPGMTWNGSSYNLALIFGKSYTDWKFRNVSTGATSFTWAVHGLIDNPNTGKPFFTQDSEGNGTANYIGNGLYYPPQLKAGSDTYEYGQDIGVNGALVGCDDIYSLSNIDLAYFEGWYLQTGTASYYFGNPVQAGMPLDRGLGVYYEKPQVPLSIISIGVHLFSKSGNVMPSNSPLKMTIYPLTSAGKPDWNNPIASSEIYKEELTPAFKFKNDPTQIYHARFAFTEYDEFTGLEKDVTLVLEEAFVTVLSFDTSKTFDFGVLFADAPHIPYIYGSSVFYSGGKEYSLTVSATDKNNGCDMAFTIEGLLNTLEIDEESNNLTVPKAGGYAVDKEGYNDIVFYSSFPFDEDIFEITSSDWLTVDEYSNEYFDDWDVFLLTVKGTAFQGEGGRTGYVTVSSYGISATLTVTQGVTGISSPKIDITTATRNGDDFILNYPATTTSVTVYNVAGQKVASYKLPSNGTFTVPAGNYSTGVYLFNFSGTNGNSAVKVMK